MSGTARPVHLWANENDVEPAALQQLRNIASLEWVHGVRVMPDVHLGKGATVGSVIAMRQAVSPSAVGVDIGCGVSAVKTSLTEKDLDGMHRLRLAIEAAIPVGFSGHRRDVELDRLGLGAGEKAFWAGFRDLHPAVRKLESRAQSQLGTLGGGNHFIEVCVDEAGSVWLTLHSGSRNIGKSLAEIHIDIAKGLSHNDGIVDKDLAVFLSGTPEMEAYRRDLWWAQDYAARSRSVMMALFKEAVAGHFAAGNVTFGEEINVHHNYVSEELIEGERMLVTRKGAIRAARGDLALIPGSMGTGSYVVRGLGNDASFQSASHGAGRRMSRTAAKRAFTVDDLIMQTTGVESRKDQGIVDEIPGAYKDIHGVIDAQKDLVEVVQHLRTVLCVKG
ncbi:RtcB family protein [Arthrobacter bambusae]|uniref:3'-phosphate/5'-hydroxy nucleic acid ligase n=1 Tax=Arthrobacter bambusae TaxID=1338426 RepID=A0AAW8D6F2_9MICC|nr:RtcB family protein [Arthrobacter bambusae]MDP9903275.1 tRNA-splicing ligase RtcB [Arthrobacter bambusae]MDQ0128731.1 tRNA-splicing ligase RtcB [Arthrobacter bambusae]MDQ0180072.1 tRNA-splicing ligase RtcB [Arthrobacter bambusae]